MNALRKMLTGFALAAALVLAVAPARAQKSEPPVPEMLSSAVPKDVYTRAKLHTELGSMYFQNGNLIVALEELTIAISINPNYAQAYSTRGLVLYYIKELASAEKDFQRALDLDAKDPEISNNYGWFLCQTGKEKESIAYFERAIRNPLYQTPETAYLNAGACYIKLGDLASAEEYVRKNLRFSRDNPQALFQLAKISYLRGNYDAAREHLKKVVRQIDPDAETLWLSLRVERRLGDRLAESSLLAQLRRKYPDSPEYQEFLKGNFE
ncbi:MAG: type pilus biosis/stability protein PilW [Proteobacteria bacterium]|nr:type pilus biosis/stability protein PilW [Pseudomonadota bacterium]